MILEWGDGTHEFKLAGKQIEELERVCGNVGFGAIYQRIMLGVWFYKDLRETVRLALIGGGKGGVEALKLVEMYVDGVPLVAGPNSPETLAKAILGEVLMGLSELKPPGEQ